jgi:hypothetical protein
MDKTSDLIKQGRTDEIWQKYCGFLDLSLEELMEIQKRLLMEQIQLLSQCELGRKLLGGKIPTSVEEFRSTVPLTTYTDYAPYLLEQKEEGLPAKPYIWVRTSGRSGEYECKWVPYSQRMYEAATRIAFAGLIFGSCSRRGEVIWEEDDVLFNALAPAPYLSGVMAGEGLLTQFPFKIIPPLRESRGLEFQQRMQMGFQMAIGTGIDVIYGIASVLVRIGEQLGQSGAGFQMSLYYLHPLVLFRVVRGLVRSKLAGRNLLPKDLWQLKFIGAGGTDTAIFKDKIEEYWGKAPVEGYGGTEMMMVASQLWNRKGMVFYSDSNFLEFVPEDEHVKSGSDHAYQPRTVLLNEVKPGERYELVITNFYGGVFVRYRVGDLIEIVALRDEEVGVDIPQMVFHSRVDDIIDIAGFTRLTEKVIWQAIQNSGVEYVEWTARKEVKQQQPILHLYIELKDDVNIEELQANIHQNLKKIDADYNDLEKMLGLNPLHITPLSEAHSCDIIKLRKQPEPIWPGLNHLI